MKKIIIGFLLTSSIAFAGQNSAEIINNGKSISVHLQGVAAKVLYESLELIPSGGSDSIKSGDLASCARHLNTDTYECFARLEKDASIPAF